MGFALPLFATTRPPAVQILVAGERSCVSFDSHTPYTTAGLVEDSVFHQTVRWNTSSSGLAARGENRRELRRKCIVGTPGWLGPKRSTPLGQGTILPPPSVFSRRQVKTRKIEGNVVAKYCVRPPAPEGHGGSGAIFAGQRCAREGSGWVM